MDRRFTKLGKVRKLGHLHGGENSGKYHCFTRFFYALGGVGSGVKIKDGPVVAGGTCTDIRVLTSLLL